MSDYVSKRTFEIFMLEGTGMPTGGYSLQKVMTSMKPFEFEDEAESWIQYNGDRQTDYVIFPVYRKP